MTVTTAPLCFTCAMPVARWHVARETLCCATPQCNACFVKEQDAGTANLSLAEQCGCRELAALLPPRPPMTYSRLSVEQKSKVLNTYTRLNSSPRCHACDLVESGLFCRKHRGYIDALFTLRDYIIGVRHQRTPGH